MRGPVFVIGTGRSGTCWLARSLGDHPDIHATIEAQPMFGWSTSMALDPTLEGALFGKLVRAYERRLSRPGLYLDKSHPNIWLAEKLKEAFPQALFVGIERGPYATVASMLKHQGVLEWHRRWREFPIPNRFLGITEGLAATYGSMPLASQCAVRWVTHRDRTSELEQVLGDDLLVVSHESLVRDTEQALCELQRFLGLRRAIPTPAVRTDTLHKWKERLSDEEILQIQGIVGGTRP